MSHFPHFYVALQIRYKIRMLQLLKGEKTKVKPLRDKYRKYGANT